MSNEEKVELKIEECIKERDEYLEGWKRAKADFVNYKREEIERTERIVQYREDIIILEIIRVIDDFESAEKEIPKEHFEKDEILKGFKRIKERLESILASFGVKEVESVGDFNPNFQEAVEIVEGEKSGTILEEISKGYLREGRLIRPSKVKIIK